MGRTSKPCSQADITRLIKAALAAGIGMEKIAGVKLTRDGAVLIFGEQKPLADETENEWDKVLGE